MTNTGCCRLQFLAPDADSRLAGWWWCMVVVVVGGASAGAGGPRCSGTGNRC